jgi:F-type H+-transporting ATPase subunit b
MATSTDAAQGAAEAAGGTGGGLPQLDFSTWPSQIFWLAVALFVLYRLMTGVALPRISSTLEERADAIADDLDRAEEFRRKAVEAEQAYDRALAEARAKAQAIAAETRAEIQKEVDAEMEKADAEIAARAAESERRIAEIRANAMESVEQVAKDTAIEVVSAVLPEAADQAAVNKAVEAQLG